jgi:UDP-2-acetamido-2,6-beta-L-arabino-hexul-4-ose reductase
MNIVVTGANGFIGQNLVLFLNEAGFDSVSTITRADSKDDILSKVATADFIYHLAGVNRPNHEEEFTTGNIDLTDFIINHLIKLGKKVPIVLTSSIQASLDNPYGVSKAGAEDILNLYKERTGATVYIYRLPNVFGKWSRPNYNSAIATFCFNTINNLPIIINNAETELKLVYIDDVCNQFVNLLDVSIVNNNNCEITPIYKTTVGEVFNLLEKFKESRSNLVTEKVGAGLIRALYSTYLSFLRPEQFSYSVTRHGDERGSFVEMLKTKNSGQFSFFTAHVGITRGGHYHHSKTEKFLVIKGKALFKFKHVLSGDYCELLVDGEESKVVETAPGWSHDITNVGDDELIVMLWANEIFDLNNPDTYAKPL